jgi:hypothetical protein
LIGFIGLIGLIGFIGLIKLIENQRRSIQSYAVSSFPASQPPSIPAFLSVEVIARVFGLTLPVIGEVLITGAIPNKTAESFRITACHIAVGGLLGYRRADRIQRFLRTPWITGAPTRHQAQSHEQHCQIFHFPHKYAVGIDLLLK